VRNMHVHACLFSRKEEEAKWTVTNDGAGHANTVTTLVFKF
jgi:hypothetical protein